MKCRGIIVVLSIFFVTFTRLSFAGTADDAYSYWKRGNEFFNKGQYESAIESFLKSAQLYEKTPNKKDLGNAYGWIGDSYYQLGSISSEPTELTNAIKYYEYSLKIFRGINNEEGKRWVIAGIGNSYYEIGKGYEGQISPDYDRAIENYKKSLEAYKEIDNKKSVGTVLSRIGVIYYHRSENLGERSAVSEMDNAIRYFKLALSVFEELHDTESTVSTVMNISTAYLMKGDYADASNTLQDSIEKLRIAGDIAGMSRLVFEKGHVYKRVGEEYQDKMNEIGLDSDEGVAAFIDYYERAVDSYMESYRTHKDFEDTYKVDYRSTIDDKAQYKYVRVVFTLARDYFDSWYSLKDLGSDALRKVISAGNDETLLEKVHKKELEIKKDDVLLDCLKRALANEREFFDFGVLYTEVGGVTAMPERNDKYPKHVCLILQSLAAEYTRLNQYEKAVSCYNEVLRISRELGEKNNVYDALVGFGDLYRSQKRYREAIPYYEESLTMVPGDKSYVETKTLIEVGDIYIDLHDYKNALHYLMRLREKKGISDWERIDCLNKIGFIYLSDNKPEAAISYFREALSIGGSIGYVGLGRAYKGLNNLEEAYNAYYKALPCSAIEDPFIKSSMEVYQEFIDILLRMKRYEYAYFLVEDCRSQDLLKLLNMGVFDTNKTEDKRLLAKKYEYLGKIQALGELYATLKNRPGIIPADLDNETLEKQESKYNENLKGIENETSLLESEYSIFLEQIRKSGGEIASLMGPSGVDVKTVQGLLDPDSTVIEFFSTPSGTYVFLLTRDTFKTYTIPITDTELAKKVNTILLPNISNKSRRAESVITPGAPIGETNDTERLKNREKFVKESVEIYNLLLGPFENDIKTKHLIIIPYGALHKLPFSALSDGSQYLIDKYSISVLPSASVLEYMKDKGKSNKYRLLAFADPKTDAVPLFFAEREVDEILKLFPDNAVYGKESATETRFRDLSGKFDIVHLACHGEFDDASPLLSCLLLAKDSNNDGSLHLNELFGLDLSEANLITLSACETALSKVENGEDLVGMSKGLLYAGAQSIVASLWSVDDKSTAILMTKFYENWKSGMTKAEALRKAQIEVKSMEGYSHPFYWAAFELIGDGK